MESEPIARSIDDLIEGPRLLEQVSRLRDDVQALDAVQPRKRVLIELQHTGIGAAHYQQSRRANQRESIASEVRTTPACTTAAISGFAAAATSAAAEPVLAPKSPIGKAAVSGSQQAKPIASSSRAASRGTLKTLRRSLASCSVRRSNSNVAIARRCNCSATYVLRGLSRLLPLPWAKITRPVTGSGTVKIPSSCRGPIATTRGHLSTPYGDLESFPDPNTAR
jgi:hypothetical protein